MDAVSFDEVINVIEDALHNDFQVDAETQRRFTSAHLLDPLEEELPDNGNSFEHLFNNNKPINGQLTLVLFATIFGEDEREMASNALIHLKNEGVPGLFIIRSCDEKCVILITVLRFLTDWG